MKIIRTFWGDIEKYNDHILNAVQYDLKETVYVWGIENFHYLSSLGYHCWLVKKEKYDPAIGSHSNNQFKHKLVGLDLGIRQHGEVLFLDWDCFIVKNFDKYFYESLTKGFELRVPLYCYPKHELDKLQVTLADNEFFKGICKHIPTCSYDFDGNYAIPNAGFIYCRNQAITQKLLSYADGFESLIEEFAIMSYVKEQKISFIEYIDKIEPNGIYGTTQHDPIWIKEQEALNLYISSIIEKNIYIKHN